MDDIQSRDLTHTTSQPTDIHLDKVSFEDLEKKYETHLDKSKITVFRLDGHSFSKFTSRFKKPFDDGFTQAMKQTALQAFTYYNFSLGFVGSDEITLCILPKKTHSGELQDIMFSGRVEKMTTLLAGYVSIVFYKEFGKVYSMDSYYPHFDCRVYQVDTVGDLLQNISERVTYTLKNSRMMFAQSYFSPKRLNKISSKQAVQLVLTEKNIDFYKVVSEETRLGTVIVTEKNECKKEVVIKGELCTVEYTRTKPKMLNLSSESVLDLDLNFGTGTPDVK
jgi:tRNA(His) guanylyltransferase